VRPASTISLTRRWPGATSRCVCGYCASISLGLNLSNRQIAKELGLCRSDVQAMTEQLRRGLAAKAPEVMLKGEVEPDAKASSGIDEVYVVAGHKGQPAAVAKQGGSGAVASWQARRAAARWRRTSHPSSA